MYRILIHDWHDTTKTTWQNVCDKKKLEVNEIVIVSVDKIDLLHVLALCTWNTVQLKYTVFIYINALLCSLQFKTNCRSHFAFVEDCLDAHIVGAAMKYLEIRD